MLVIAALALIMSASTPGETLTVTLPNGHEVWSRQPNTWNIHAVWSDERVFATVSLTVADLPGEPLRIVAANEHWPDLLQWSLIRRHKRVARARPRLIRAFPISYNRPTFTQKATFDLGTQPAGEYELVVTAGGARGVCPFSVLTGSEPIARDTWLRDRAEGTRDYRTFRELELERFRRDPQRTDAAHRLLDRSLNEGSETEIREDIERVLKANGRPIKPSKDPYLHSLLLARTSVPELIGHRPDWAMSFDSHAMAFVIYSRAQHAIIRTFR